MKTTQVNEQFDKVDNVDLSRCHILTNNGKVIGIKGNVYITTVKGLTDVTYCGEHGLNDYVIEYGFKIELD
jgi:hypothetical protein